MNALARLEKLVGTIRGILDGGEVRDEAAKEITHGAEIIEKVITHERTVVAEAALAAATAAEAERAAAIAEIETLAKEKGLSVKVAAKSKKPKSKKPSDAAEIRVWAAENGVEVPARGRIPASARQAYLASRS